MRLRGEPPIELTPREAQIASLIAHGYNNKYISRQLGIKVQTVKNTTARLMSKLGTSDRLQTALVYWDIQ